jgi:hypothetical protein
MPMDGGDEPPARRLGGTGGSSHALRAASIGRVLEVISFDRGLSQAEAARRTGLSRATVGNLVAERRRRGLIDGGVAGFSGRRSAARRSDASVQFAQG